MDAMIDRCPNNPPCEHPAMLHDIYEPGDPYPTCCAGDCRCGQPGDATCQRDIDGTVTVLRADPVIRVTNELLADADPRFWDPESQILTLDTAGTYRYQYLRPDPRERACSIFGRVTG